MTENIPTREDLIKAIDAEMGGVRRGYADKRGELLFSVRSFLTAQQGEAVACELFGYAAPTIGGGWTLIMPDDLHKYKMAGGGNFTALYLGSDDSPMASDSERKGRQQDEANDDGPYWIILRDAGKVPERKGPFPDQKWAIDFVREVMAHRPGTYITVMVPFGDHEFWPEDGGTWLSMIDRRMRPTYQRYWRDTEVAHREGHNPAPQSPARDTTDWKCETVAAIKDALEEATFIQSDREYVISQRAMSDALALLGQLLEYRPTPQNPTVSVGREDVLRNALLKARDRIENEDWQGTCGCIRNRKRCGCKREHDEFLAMIDAALQPGERSDG